MQREKEFWGTLQQCMFVVKTKGQTNIGAALEI